MQGSDQLPQPEPQSLKWVLDSLLLPLPHKQSLPRLPPAIAAFMPYLSANPSLPRSRLLILLLLLHLHHLHALDTAGADPDALLLERLAQTGTGHCLIPPAAQEFWADCIAVYGSGSTSHVCSPARRRALLAAVVTFTSPPPRDDAGTPLALPLDPSWPALGPRVYDSLTRLLQHTDLGRHYHALALDFQPPAAPSSPTPAKTPLRAGSPVPPSTPAPAVISGLSLSDAPSTIPLFSTLPPAAHTPDPRACDMLRRRRVQGLFDSLDLLKESPLDTAPCEDEGYLLVDLFSRLAPVSQHH
ncbi:MAG: hypothetical protein SGCHY_002419 [Lobulomycetales sp.]